MSEDWVDDLPREAPGLAAMADARSRTSLPALIRSEAEHAERMEAVLDALSRGICNYHDADSGRDSGEAYPCWSCSAEADALIAAGVLDAIRAEAWDEGTRAVGDQWANGDGPIKNPYRAEAS